MEASRCAAWGASRGVPWAGMRSCASCKATTQGLRDTRTSGPFCGSNLFGAEVDHAIGAHGYAVCSRWISQLSLWESRVNAAFSFRSCASGPSMRRLRRSRAGACSRGRGRCGLSIGEASQALARGPVAVATSARSWRASLARAPSDMCPTRCRWLRSWEALARYRSPARGAATSLGSL